MTTRFAAFLFASVATVAAAQAVQFNFQSTGTASASGTTLSGHDTILRQYMEPTPTASYTFVSLDYSYTANFTGASLTGIATNGTGTLVVRDVVANANKTLNFSFVGLLSRTSGSSLSNVNVTANNFALSGSGLTGTGSLSGNLWSPDSLSTFTSTFSPVPEPASLAALGLGAVGLMRRRRKA